MAACNGGSACGTFAQHKLYTGLDYITFTAHTNIDIYVMYDTRGGIGPYALRKDDLSADAPWLTTAGFVDTGYEIRTTDAVTYYTVYKKSYLQGQTVRLHGNRRGVSDPKINTNYWVVMKRMGVTAPEPASSLCEAAPDANPPANVLSLRAAPGATTVRLSWQNPGDLDFAGVVIRRGTGAPPAGPGEGVPVTGTVVSPQAYEDAGLTPGLTYYYTVFALDTNNNYRPGASAVAITGTDGDGDGLSDTFETIFNYRAYFPATPLPELTDMTNPDTDGDGISDGDEFLAGTDPTNSDATAPTISAFTLDTPTPTTKQTVPITLNGSDDTAVTGWLITYSGTAPLSSHPNWSATKPADVTLPPASASYTLYAWARDAAGNVSAAFVPINLELQLGATIPRWAYVSYRVRPADALHRLKTIDPASGILTPITDYAAGSGNAVHELQIHPTGKYAYSISGSGLIRVYSIDPNTGNLVSMRDSPAEVLNAPYNQIRISTDGRYLYALLDFPLGSPRAIGVYPINLSDGSLLPRTQSLDLNNNLWSGSTAFLVHPSGRYLVLLEFVNNIIGGGGQNLRTFGINSNNGQLIFIRKQALGTLNTGYLRYPQFTRDGLYLIGNSLSGGVNPYSAIMLKFDANDGMLSYQSRINIVSADPVPVKVTRVGVDPDSSYLYLFYWRQPAGPGGPQEYGIVPVDFSTALSSLSITTAQLQPFPLLSERILGLTITNSNIYANSDSGQNVLRGATYVFDTKSIPGPISLAQSLVEPVGSNTSKFNTAILEERSQNDPPLAYAGVDRNILVGTVHALQGYNSYDPDAARCNAVRANYVYQWTFASVPTGSSLTDVNISNAGTLSSASFTPDVRGDYVLQLRFTDDPGTCNGPAASSVATVKYTALDLGRYPPLPGSITGYWNAIPAAPPGLPAGAVNLRWNKTRPNLRQDWGIMRGFLLRYLPVPPFPLLIIPTCTTPVSERSVAQATCAERHRGLQVLGGAWLVMGARWEHQFYREFFYGYWTWWE